MTQSAECCRRYNDGKCKQSPNTCRYSHRCMECGGPHPWLQCPRGGHRGSYARPRSPISLGRLAQPPGAPGHLRRLRPVGHGLESDGSRSSGTPPPQNCPSRSMSCYPFCWLIFSGVVRGETTRWCATAIIRQWSPVFAPALASTRVSCTHLIPRYINTHTNHLADDLSRNRVLSFLSKVPQVCPYLTLIPQDVISLLLDPRADWTSRRWQALFRDTLLKA